MRSSLRILILWALTLAVLLGLAALSGCGGGSSKVLTPDPLAVLKVGTDSTLEVVTWNLENYAKAGNRTVAQVAAVVRAMDVDVVALQEIEDRNYFEDLVEALEGWEGFRAGGTSTWMELAYLYRSGGPLEVTSVYEIMSGNSRPFPRPPLVLQGTRDGQPLVVINNHLKCCGDGVIDAEDDGDEETRRRDACVLLEQYVIDHFNGYQVIMVGDWNDELRDAPANNVFQNFLEDGQSWRFTDLPIALNTGALWSYPGWPSHLDHILINSPLFAAFEADESDIQVLPVQQVLGGAVYEAEVSDHLPVVLRLGAGGS